MFNQYTYNSLNSLGNSVELLNSSVDNINNMATTAYKTKSPSFHETLNGIKSKEHRDFSSGLAKKTRRELDFAIQGVGFFEVQMPDGTLAYTRDGSFKLNNAGELVSSQGFPISNKQSVSAQNVNQAFDSLDSENKTFSLSVLSKKITVPAGQSPELTMDGTLKDLRGNDIGQLRVVTFNNLDGLKDAGGGLYTPTEQSGDIEEVALGDRNGESQIKQGYLESSNMSVIDNMAKIVQTNTTIKAKMKIIKMLDSMQETINSTIARSV